MINRLIELSLKNRFIVLALYLGARRLGLRGRWRRRRSTRSPTCRTTRSSSSPTGRATAPQEVEDQVTYPLTVEPAGSRRRARRALAVGVRLLDDLRGLRGQRRSVFRARPRARADEPRHAEPAGRRRRRRSARTRPASGTSSGTRVESADLSLRELRIAAGLVHPLSAQRRARRRRSRVGRRLRPAVSDRRRSESAPRATACRSSAVVAAVRESNRNVGGNVVEANGAWSIVRGVGLIAIGRGRRADRRSARRRACRSTSSRSATVQLGDAFRVASLVKGTRRSGRRRRRRAHGRQHAGRSSTPSRRGSRRSRPGSRAASGSSRSTTAPS